DRIHLTEPFDYPRFASLLSCAYLILSDSGGIQEEAPSLGKPVLVLRDESERPEAVEAGTARVVGTKRQGIVDAARTLLTDRSAYQQMARVANPFGDGKASPRIVDHCLCYLESCGRQGFRGSG
ncbi:UDP-N-acetylglucosamine 2-epimerase, partial [candidate division TA06 bacterium SM1_40]